MNSLRSNSLRLKYQRFTPSSGKGNGISEFEFVAKTQFFSRNKGWKKIKMGENKGKLYRTIHMNFTHTIYNIKINTGLPTMDETVKKT